MKSSFHVRVAVLLVAGTAVVGAQGNTEEFARRQFDSGMTFMQSGRYTEALKDFQTILDSFGKSSVADNALLQTALYQLEIARDTGAAQTSVDRLLKDYPDTDSAPMAHIVAGRIALAKGRAPADVDAALASFERVPRLFPNDEAVPAAGFYAADALRIVRRTDEALERFRRVSMEYPRAAWAARARLGAALCLVASDRAPRALDELQRVRQQLPESAEANDALNYNTILYRLYVRPPAQPAYGFAARYPGTEGTKLKDIVGVQFDQSGQMLLGHKLGVSVFDPRGKLARTIAVEEPSSFFVDERGRVITVRKDRLTIERGETTPLTVPQPDGKQRPVEEIPSAVAMASGARLIADHKGKQVIKVSESGAFVGKFVGVDAERLALNRLDDVAMIDKETKSIVVVDREGKPLSKIPQKGAGYEFDNPIDLKFDAFNHIYVLDRGRASIFVFGPRNKLLTTVTIPDKSPGAFPRAEAFALDAAGRIYVFDDRAQTIQVYQ
ncbi:MAG TPA: tetratricopeptide repeat protein [Vicinamibacterales bacterium]|nr:tetratricopeptide repeat protein [Vicinamibacterales bacterium]